MLLFDVNVLVYAHREDAPNHESYREFLEGIVNGDAAYGMATLALSGFLRVVTHRRVFDPPSTMADALSFANQLWQHPSCTVVEPGPRHWEIFERLCSSCGVRGNLVPDGYFAALAIESGCEWITTDRDFARFVGLKWRHPLTSS